MSGKEKGNHVYKLLCPYDPTSPLINDYNAGDLVCSKCGLVVGDRVIDVHQEWRMFHNDEKSEQRSRVGDPEINLLGNNNLSTSLAFPKNFNRKIKSSLLNSPLSFSYTGNRTLQPAFRAINDMADRVNAPSHIADRACDIYKQVHDLKRHSYYSNFTRAASCLYIACRQEGSPRTLREICAAATVDKKELGRCYMLILKLLGISAGGIDGSDYMNRFCSFLGLDESVKDAAIHISEKTVEMELCSGRSPISIAAAAILMACKIADLNVTQKRISEVAGITYVTVSGCFKLMVPYAEELMPRNSKFPTPTGYELERLLAKKVMYDEKPGEILTTQESIFSSPYADRVEKLLAKNRGTDQLYGKEQVPITTKIPKTNIDKLQKLLQDEYGSAESNSKDNVGKSVDTQNDKLQAQNIGTDIKYNENLKTQNMNYSTLYKEEMVKLLSQQQLQLGVNDKSITQSNTFQKEYAEHLAKVLKQNGTGVKLQSQNTITPKTTTVQRIQFAGKKYENGSMFNEQLVKQTCQCPTQYNDELAKQELLKKWNSEEKTKPKESKTKLPYADILTKVRSKKFNPENQNDPNLISKEATILKRRSDEVVRFALKKA
ncbi:transcription factor IIIB 70 kDa subunit-like, partial [Teleopsis dalmanni]|uniref:transcription factor IIIB 70 kDa subunit-like n=1 Tax=Teleopsis dalmanni TaxID=139649 RepID=UPI0018CDDB19